MSKSRNLTITVSVPEDKAGIFLADLAEQGFDQVRYELETLQPFNKNAQSVAKSHIVTPMKRKSTGPRTTGLKTTVKQFVFDHVSAHPGGIGFGELSKFAVKAGLNPNVGSYLGQLITERKITKDENKLYHVR